jgi:hypothetical protein
MAKFSPQNRRIHDSEDFMHRTAIEQKNAGAAVTKK